MAILGREKFSIRHSRHITIPVRVTIFPYEWLSSCGKKKILHSRLRRSWRIFFSPRLLSHSWGKIVTCTGIVMCLSWLIENFKFLYSRLRRSYRNFPVPKSPNDIIGSFPIRNWLIFYFLLFPSFLSVWFSLVNCHSTCKCKYSCQNIHTW